ncbi:MAG: hypothetical protein Q9177_003510, partial [Variospora cf. flavescens]
ESLEKRSSDGVAASVCKQPVTSRRTTTVGCESVPSPASNHDQRVWGNQTPYGSKYG